MKGNNRQIHIYENKANTQDRTAIKNGAEKDKGKRGA